ncbi:MAG: YceI family protein [Nitrospirae bacterium]|nr:YceI family protein [Nitrospirota bacterium]
MATWIIDTDHSVASFSVRHMMIADVHGQFNNVTGRIEFDPSDPARSSADIVVEVASLISGIQKRDAHVLSGDFFDAAKYPSITFKSTQIVMTGSRQGKVSGDLTIRAITRQVTLDVTFSGPVKVPAAFGGETSIGFTGTCAINREDFGILWNVPLDKGGLMVGKEIRLTIDIEADLSE